MVKIANISIACNRTTNGSFEGQFRAIDWTGIFSIFTFADPEPCEYIYDEKTRKITHIKIADIPIKVYKHINWYGNWCWDGISISIEDLHSLLTYLRGKKSWNIEEAYVPFESLWEHNNLKVSDLIDLVERYKKDSG